MAKEKKGKKNKQQGFSVNPDRERRSFEAIPAGKYPVFLVESEVRKTKAGDGRYLACQFKVSDGDYVNRVIFNNFNMDNASEAAQDIAMDQFMQFMEALGVSNLPGGWEHPTELLNQPVLAKVRIDKGNEQYEDSNSISGFEPAKKSKKAKKGKKGKKGEEGWEDTPF